MLREYAGPILLVTFTISGILITLKNAKNGITIKKQFLSAWPYLAIMTALFIIITWFLITSTTSH